MRPCNMSVNTADTGTMAEDGSSIRSVTNGQDQQDQFTVYPVKLECGENPGQRS